MSTRWLLVPLATALACSPRTREGADTTRADTAAVAAGIPADTPPPDTTPRVTADTGTPPPPSDPSPRPKSRPPSPAPTPPPRTTPPGTARDSARGVVRIVGSLPVNVSVVLTPEGSTSAIRLSGDGAATLRQLGGVEVVVRGTRTASGEFDVASFTVRSVNGDPAVDGVLVVDGGGLAIDTDGGRRRVSNPPDALRELVGARVWITGSLDRGPNMFGVIRR
ncbi:MAG TPA: hypothetical protein VJ596_01150 [Gemmatimonadaceae bacterium]|nr:hypothetical protein [Gemmatimonadaceae bacterium]